MPNPTWVDVTPVILVQSLTVPSEFILAICSTSLLRIVLQFVAVTTLQPPFTYIYPPHMVANEPPKVARAVANAVVDTQELASVPSLLILI
jgi:hypothetical protein